MEFNRTTSLSNTWNSKEHFIKTKYGVTQVFYKTPRPPHFMDLDKAPLWVPFYLLFCLITDSLGTSIPKMRFTSAIRWETISHQSWRSICGGLLLRLYINLSSFSHKYPNWLLYRPRKISNLKFDREKPNMGKSAFHYGGAINLTKSHWFRMNWQWSNGSAVLDPIHHQRQLLLMAWYNQTPVPVPQLSPYDS